MSDKGAAYDRIGLRALAQIMLRMTSDTLGTLSEIAFNIEFVYFIDKWC
jgi:hypothetical protein